MKHESTDEESTEYVLTEGPLPKSTYTYQLEEITQQLLRDIEFNFTQKNNEDYISIGKQKYNWTKIIKYANLEHIELNPSDFLFYRDYLKKGFNKSTLTPRNEILYRRELYQDYYLYNRRLPDPVICMEEMQAINIYTGEGYESMNALLRNEFDFQSNSTTHTRDTIIQSVMCASGLRKIPQTTLTDAYRGGKMPSETELQERIEAAETHGVIQLSGFVSSSTEKAASLEHKPLAFHFTNLKGAYIAPISQTPSEKEFLIPPTQVQLSKHYVENNRHCFEGRIVSYLGYSSPSSLEVDESKVRFETHRVSDMSSVATPPSPGFVTSGRITSSHDFASVMELLPLSERDSLFNTIQKNNKLRQLIKSPDDLIHVLMFLSPMQCNTICRNIEDLLPKIIDSEDKLNRLCSYLLPDQLKDIKKYTENLTLNNIINNFQLKAAAFIHQSVNNPKLSSSIAEINILSSYLNSNWVDKKASQRNINTLLSDKQLQALMNMDITLNKKTGIKSLPIVRELYYGLKNIKNMVTPSEKKSGPDNINTIKEMKMNLNQFKNNLDEFKSELSIQSNKNQ